MLAPSHPPDMSQVGAAIGRPFCFGSPCHGPQRLSKLRWTAKNPVNEASSSSRRMVAAREYGFEVEERKSLGNRLAVEKLPIA